MRKFVPLAVLICIAVIAISQNAPQHVGKLSYGGFLLSTGWRLAPEGIQIPFAEDTFPMNLVMHPDHKNLFILNSGYKPPSVMILDTSDLKGAMKVKLEDAWLGLALNKAGDRFYVPEANLGTVREFSFTAGQNPKALREFKLFNSKGDETKKGKAVLTKTDYLGDATISPDGKWLYVANMQNNMVHVIDLSSGDVSRKWTTGTHPYKLLATVGKLYVSNWGGESISILDPADGKTVLNFKTGAHPTAMLLHEGRLYVTCSNTNEVYVHDPDTGVVRERINIALHPKSPPGSTPNWISASADGKRLFVAN